MIGGLRKTCPLLPTQKMSVLLERSEESAWQMMTFFRWKWLLMQDRSFVALEDDGCFLAMNNAGEVFRRSESGVVEKYFMLDARHVR